MKKLRHRESKELVKCHMSQKRHKLKKQTKIQLYCTNLQNISLAISHYCCCTQSPSHVQLSTTPWTAACQASLSLTIFQSLPKFMSIVSAMPSHNLMLCYSLLLLPSIFPSIRVFSNESAVGIRGPKYRSFSFRINPYNKYLGLISFMFNWFDFLAFQGTLKRLLQHHHQKHQFYGALPSFPSRSQNHT